ncbi:hypothetical protein GCM10007301_24400 [Azorhizobium oxalatiphilum]|uniref:Uncharacterized protein n=1 Tax=Azorhizobium oxalatiphilum TaxID=980631 RepID=A0A917FB07_9HYPH|nr:hypothetical protein [Azorhizobium oxalatiphilum]GGF63732.1 hypothetical protein GCM10007301_24400 [Azorhizobium oxalatiphilum]
MTDVTDAVLGRMERLEWLMSQAAAAQGASALVAEDLLLEEQIRKFGPTFLAKYNTHLFSQAYEDAAISEIFARIGTRHKTFIEIGVEDGSENTTRLLLMLGWKGVWIEGNAGFYNRITDTFANEIASGQLQAIHAMAEPDTVQSLIDSANLGPEVDLLSVDIDQHTSHVFRAIQTSARAACVEYNAHFPPAVDYEVPYVPGAAWNGTNWFGASLKRLEVIAAGKDLSLVGCDLMGINAFFVRNDLTEDRFPKPFTAGHHYQPPRYQLIRPHRGHRKLSGEEARTMPR